MIRALADLCDEYAEFCGATQLPRQSADELYLSQRLRPWQKAYIADFIRRWKLAEDAESRIRPPAYEHDADSDER